MNRTSRATLAAIAAIAVAFSLSACSVVKPDPNAPHPPPNVDGPPPATQPGSISFSEITEAEAPEELLTWVRSQQMEEVAASHMVPKDGALFIAVTGGLKPNGGYRVGLSRAFKTTVNGQETFQIDVTVTAPPPGSVTTTAMTNPMAYFKVGGGLPVQVNIVPGPQPGGGVAPLPETVSIGYSAGMKLFLVVKGTTAFSQVHVAVRSGDKILAEKDVDVVDGRYAFSPGTASEFPKGAEVVVSDAKGGTPLHTVPIPEGPLTEGPAWSENFQKATARQLDANTVLVEGAARAFEAVFKVEIHAGGKVIASQSIHAQEGAPAYGAFSARITTTAAMEHDGVEAWFIIPSAKDGSDHVQLITPVIWGK